MISIIHHIRQHRSKRYIQVTKSHTYDPEEFNNKNSYLKLYLIMIGAVLIYVVFEGH